MKLNILFLPILIRAYTAAVALPSGGLILSGGYTGSNFLDSVEVFYTTGWEATFPSIPTTVYQHCMVSINDETLLVIGGIQGSEYSTKTYLYLSLIDVWMEGPPLNVARSRHSCGVIKGAADSDVSRVIVVAGGYNGEYLNSVEVFLTNLFINVIIIHCNLSRLKICLCKIKNHGVGEITFIRKNIFFSPSHNCNWLIFKFPY